MTNEKTFRTNGTEALGGTSKLLSYRLVKVLLGCFWLLVMEPSAG